MALFEVGMEGGWVGFEDLKEEMVLQGCCPGLCSSNCVPFSMQKRSLSTCYQIHGDIVQGLVFV